MTPGTSRARPARRARPLLRGRGLLAHRAGHRQRQRHRQLHDPRPVHVRARRAAVLLLLVQGAAEPRPGRASPRPRPTSRPSATGRSTRPTATSRRRPRATRSTPTASSSASASPTSRRATPSCASRRPSPAARRPRRAWTAATRSCRSNGKAVADLHPHAARSARSSAPSRSASLARSRLARRRRAGSGARTLTKRAGHDPDRLADRRDRSAGSARVGYLHFRNFVQPSVEALNTAFTAAQRPGRHRARARPALQRRRARLGRAAPRGPDRGAAARRPGVRAVHPQRQADEPQHGLQASRRSRRRSPSRRLVVIATRGSASASEAIINGLRPYMDVKVVGDTTYGKPVGQYGFDFCDKVLYPVAFLVTNARGQADYFSGIPADCAAADDVDHALASPQEASLAEALYVAAERPLQRQAGGRPGRGRRPAPGAGRPSSRATAGARCSTPGDAGARAMIAPTAVRDRARRRRPG